MQGYQGIKQCTLIKIPNEDKQNYPFYKLKLFFENFRQYEFGTNQLIFFEVPKVLI